MKNKIHAALVINNSILAVGLREVIASLEGFAVAFVCSQPETFSVAIQGTHKPPEICLLSLPLHQADCTAVIRSYQQLVPGLKVLLLSASSHPYNARKALACGAAGYIALNSSAEEVHRALLNIHFTGHYLGEKPYVDDLHVQPAAAHGNNPQNVETRLLMLLCTELDTQEISSKLGLSKQMVEECTNILFEKFHVTSRVGLTVNAWEMGLLGV
jgi:DNA-binding NarL/FixJ family response regulator